MALRREFGGASVLAAGCATVSVSSVKDLGGGLYRVTASDPSSVAGPSGLLERAHWRASLFCEGSGMMPQYADQKVTGVVLVTGEAVDFRCIPKPPPPKTLRDNLNGLIGKNIRAAITYLGYPDSQDTIVGDVVYTWDHSAITNLPRVVTSTTGAVIGDDVGTADTTSISGEMIALRCKLRIGTDMSGTIKRYQLDGNAGACADYARGFQIDPLPKPATGTQ